MNRLIATLTLASGLLLGQSVLAAPQLQPGDDVMLEGRVMEVVSHDAFWMEQDGVRVLVYQNFVPRKALRPGQQLRVAGRVSDDWMRLTQFEVDAHDIQNRPTTLTAGAR